MHAVMASPVDPFVTESRIAYFSMEIAIRPEIHTYSGGLGILAGDTMRSCADLELPLTFVTLVNRAGYFHQTIDATGRQVAAPDWWQPADWCSPLEAMMAVEIEQRPVWIRPWLYVHTSSQGRRIPIVLLDTDLEENEAADREITHYLYGGDETYRLKQEIVLGIGGTRLLRALGFDIHTYHLNEGHAALLTLELLGHSRPPQGSDVSSQSPHDVAQIRERCVFTTHTPVAAGQDQFSYDLFQKLAPNIVDLGTIKGLAGKDRLNMTQLALNLSGYVNGVAQRHAETTRHMFPGHRIHAVTNGVHLGTWVHDAYQRLFQASFPKWELEPEALARAPELSDEDVWQCHLTAKADLIARVQAITGTTLDPGQPVLCFARRMTEYKRPLLLFSDIERLTTIAAHQPFQVVIAGKAHPRDTGGQEAIRRIYETIRQMSDRIKAVFLPGYDMELAKVLVAGADVWLNTPLPPFEASGTSGMKAALNGVLNLSVLDGWWVEACIDGVNGWAIGADGDGNPERDHAAALYGTLENTVLPLFRTDPGKWRWMMKQAIATIPPFFNSHRMMRRYAAEAYQL